MFVSFSFLFFFFFFFLFSCFRAQKPTQVSFKKGDRIIVLSPPVNGWFEGRHEETFDEGQFPVSYTISEAEALSASNELSRKKDEAEDVIMVCKCLQDYVGKPGELSFKEHDRLEVLEKMSDKVFRCRFKGKGEERKTSFQMFSFAFFFFFFYVFVLVGTVASSMLEEDKGFTIRKAAASKQASRDQFQNRRVKEQTSIDTKKAGSADLSALKKEQEKLAMERDKLQKVCHSGKAKFCVILVLPFLSRTRKPKKRQDKREDLDRLETE